MDKILKASYGDRQQREANAGQLNRLAAVKVEQEYKERRAGQPRHEASAPMPQCPC